MLSFKELLLIREVAPPGPHGEWANYVVGRGYMKPSIAYGLAWKRYNAGSPPPTLHHKKPAGKQVRAVLDTYRKNPRNEGTESKEAFQIVRRRPQKRYTQKERHSKKPWKTEVDPQRDRYKTGGWGSWR